MEILFWCAVILAVVVILIGTCVIGLMIQDIVFLIIDEFFGS